MGLPIWRDPEEKREVRDAVKTDPTAASRSTIRRRPSVHGRRSTRPRLARDATVHPPAPTVQQSRDSRRHTVRGVPPISTLLEATHYNPTASPPPPVPESRNYYAGVPRTRPGARGHRDELARLENRATVLREETSRLRHLAAEARRRAHHQRARLPDEASVSLRTSPEPMRRSDRPQSRDGGSARRSALPTPPLDASDPDADSLFVPEVRLRPSHPLSNVWRPDSPVDGLGDRNRSPTPVDDWEIMRSTITPDATLPSADSSFTSAAASHSFSANNDTNVTESQGTSSTDNSRRGSSDDVRSESVSSVDPDDMICIEDDNGDFLDGVEAFADDMYELEMGTPQGRQRIMEQEEIRARDGDRFAFPHEPARVDIGFRLIEEALNTEEGRGRLLHIGVLNTPDDIRMFENVVHSRRHGGQSAPRAEHARTRGAHIHDEQPPSPQPERYGDSTRTAIGEATAQVHDYFRRFTADALRPRTTSPPPQYEPPADSQPDADTFTSREGPEPHPVGPPSQRSSEREAADAFLSGDETDLGAMRRVVERLARRDDVPDEWWSSIGLNLSRTRPHATNALRGVRLADAHRVRSGRIERGNSRL